MDSCNLPKKRTRRVVTPRGDRGATSKMIAQFRTKSANSSGTVSKNATFLALKYGLPTLGINNDNKKKLPNLLVNELHQSCN
jgi:hypothetical protein